MKETRLYNAWFPLANISDFKQYFSKFSFVDRRSCFTSKRQTMITNTYKSRRSKTGVYKVSSLFRYNEELIIFHVDPLLIDL